MIYLDNSATSYFKPPELFKSVRDYLSSPGAPERGVNSASISALGKVYDTREKVAKFFGFSNPAKVVWTSGITESLNLCINALICSKDSVITTYLEHNSVLRPLYATGCEMIFTDGTAQEIEASIKKNTKAIVINHASNVTGEVQDIVMIGSIARENGLLFILDTAQTAGVLDIDVQKCNIDFLCFTAHKGLLAMQGLGGIIVNSTQYIKPLKVGGSGIKSFDKQQPLEYPNHLEAGTQNIPGIVALGSSLDYIDDKGIDVIHNHEMTLCNQFLEYLNSRGDVDVYRSDKKSSVATVSFNIRGKDSALVSDYLCQNYDIAVRSGAMCAPLVMDHYSIPSCVRASFGLNNTDGDLLALICALDGIRG